MAIPGTCWCCRHLSLAASLQPAPTELTAEEIHLFQVHDDEGLLARGAFPEADVQAVGGRLGSNSHSHHQRGREALLPEPGLGEAHSLAACRLHRRRRPSPHGLSRWLEVHCVFSSVACSQNYSFCFLTHETRDGGRKVGLSGYPRVAGLGGT